ncbi:uncharacterized protein L203_105585 [Cryptococcus depauperatus CBS 7841]|uniref:Uncharacterized protein n=1 Tax=Cryptococcus depauperatus CBS 7841 TaxID=1295531 RepID=A0A1E3IF21_9TREE|nr:hypothetical protein L203_03462 [Cryptococcus depauperatus CBS 7841]
MSSYRRFGRFASSTTTESHQRQLAAPVNKWKREWVTPEGLPAESSYKIFKWIQTDVKAQFTGAEMQDYTTPAPDGNGDDEDEDREVNEDDEGGDDAGDEGAAETEGAEGEAEGGAVEPPSQLKPQVLAKTEEGTRLSVKQDGFKPEADNQPQTAPATVADSTIEAPILPSHMVPSNSVEIHNIAVGSAELGEDDLALQHGVKVEMGNPEDEALKVTGYDTHMEVEEPIEKDEGLVMGEMEPPVPAMGIEGQDKPVETEDSS